MYLTAHVKIVRIMKLMAILLFVACLQVSAKSYSQTITLSVKDSPLENVLNEIKKQSGYQFFLNETMLARANPVTLDVKNATVEEVLQACFRDQPFSYSIVLKTVVVKDKPAEQKDETPPPTDIHGRVTDSLGNPLSGASVYIKGTKKGTTSDVNGNFTLNDVGENGTLIVSFTGYERQEIRLNGGSQFTIKLKQAVSSLEDVVVSKGYYNTTQQLNTGDVSIVSGVDIQKQPVSDPVIALEGRVPGLSIAQTTGIPGASYTVMLRGQNSIFNGNAPLYIVDGVPFTSTSLTSTAIGGGAVTNFSASTFVGQGLSPFNNLNPADIESIEVLKDADATAIYGSRGANGVILITTKSGKAGQTKFNLNAFTGAGTVTRTMDLMNTPQYLSMRHEAFNNGGNTPGSSDYDLNGTWDTTRYTDWQKTFIGNTSRITNIQGSLSGGSNTTQFVISGGYTGQTTVYPGEYGDQKVALHANLTHSNLDQKFHVQFSADYVTDNSDLPYLDFTGLIPTYVPVSPAIYNASGTLNWEDNTWVNPFSYLYIHAKAVTNNLIGKLNASYEFFPGLQLRCNVGYNRIDMNQSILIPAVASPPPDDTNPLNRMNKMAANNMTTWIIEPQVNYNKKIGQGKLDIIAGATLQETIQNSLSQTASGFSSDALIQALGAASTISAYSSNYTQYRYSALFGRIGYNLEDKYLINLTARRDGSSRFGPGKQFGNFGAVGAAWIFSKEKWMANSLPFLSFGKLRASYGTTGNDQIQDYQFLSTYSPYSSSYQGLNGLYPTNIANPYFGWEVVKKLEAGIELGFVKDRIMLAVSYYRNRTNNQLVGSPLPSIDGFTTIEQNLPAIVQNTGVEIELNTVNIVSKNFSWKTSFNISVPRNELVAFPNLATSVYKNAYVIGKSLYYKRLYHSTGVDPQTGLYTFEDVNKDGHISSLDKEFVKEISQSYFGGFLNKFSYKRFQLDIFFQYVKQTGYTFQPSFPITPGWDISNQPASVLNRWQKPGDITSTELFSTQSNAQSAYNQYKTSDAVIGDASFIRLKNISFSYNLPMEWLQKAHMQDARIYIQAQNLITITSYRGLDPETQGLSLPPIKMVTAGLQFTF